MKKRMDFDERKIEKNEYLNEKIRMTLNAQFELPKSVNAAKEEAFSKIREMENEKTAERRESLTMAAKHKNKGKSGKIIRTAMGITAAAAAFSAVCIVNPAFASNIPLIGNIFAELGDSLGFSGDYSEYAKPLEEETGSREKDEKTENTEEGENTDEANAGQTNDSAYSKTVDGTTVTLSEVYCNDAALYLSMIIETEDEFPQTGTWQDGTPMIDLNDSTMELSYNTGYQLTDAYLDGKMLDEHRYAGVLRVNLNDTTVDADGFASIYEKRNEILQTEYGIDLMNQEDDQKLADLLGVSREQITDAMLNEFCGINEFEYIKDIEVPDKFHVTLDINKIAGYLPESEINIPEMPKEFKDAYDEAMAEYGLDEENYENFTEEEKEIEYQLFLEMHQKYDEKYPEVNIFHSPYEYWMKEGDWAFAFEVEKNDSKNIVKEINLMDEEGNGILSLTKTPFEIILEDIDPNAKYFPVVLDAKGNLLDTGKFGGDVNTLAISGKDVSTVYVYFCDYIEYMDELKGYYWSADYEEKAKTKTFKQLLDERAILKTEVTFDE